MVAQQAGKLLISAAYLLLLVMAVVKYNSAQVTAALEYHCSRYAKTVCVQCLRVPPDVHSTVTYSPFSN